MTRNVCYLTRRVERRAKSMPDIDLKDTLANPQVFVCVSVSF